MIKLYYKYDKLDNQHQYHIECTEKKDGVAWFGWVCFFIGKRFSLTGLKRYQLYLYPYQPDRELAKYESGDAEVVAAKIVHAIKQHNKLSDEDKKTLGRKVGRGLHLRDFSNATWPI